MGHSELEVDLTKVVPTYPCALFESIEEDQIRRGVLSEAS